MFGLPINLVLYGAAAVVVTFGLLYAKRQFRLYKRGIAERAKDEMAARINKETRDMQDDVREEMDKPRDADTTLDELRDGTF